MSKKYLQREPNEAFDNALSKGYKLDGVMYMESMCEKQDDGNLYFFDIFKYQVSREKFFVEFQPNYTALYYQVKDILDKYYPK